MSSASSAEPIIRAIVGIEPALVPLDQEAEGLGPAGPAGFHEAEIVGGPRHHHGWTPEAGRAVPRNAAAGRSPALGRAAPRSGGGRPPAAFPDLIRPRPRLDTPRRPTAGVLSRTAGPGPRPGLLARRRDCDRRITRGESARDARPFGPEKCEAFARRCPSSRARPYALDGADRGPGIRTRAGRRAGGEPAARGRRRRDPAVRAMPGSGGTGGAAAVSPNLWFFISLACHAAPARYYRHAVRINSSFTMMNSQDGASSRGWINPRRRCGSCRRVAGGCAALRPREDRAHGYGKRSMKIAPRTRREDRDGKCVHSPKEW